jgi:hypothetical protein
MDTKGRKPNDIPSLLAATEHLDMPLSLVVAIVAYTAPYQPHLLSVLKSYAI